MSTPPRKKRPADFNKRAYHVFQEAIGESIPQETGSEEGLIASDAMEDPPQKNPAAVELGKLGGSKGGKTRAERLSPHRRSEIAEKAARARWAKEKDQTDG